MSLLDQFFFSFALFSLFSFLGGLVSSKVRQPAVVGLLLVGMLIGPNFFALVSDNETIKILAEFGISLLLFSLGLDFSIGNLFGSLSRILFSYVFSFIFLFLLGYEIAFFIFKDVFLSIFFAFAFSFSSTAVFVNHLRSCSKITGFDFSIPVFILIIQDLVAIIILTVLFAIKNQIFGNIFELDFPFNLIIFLLPLFFSFLILSFIYIIIRNILERVIQFFEIHIDEENIILLILGLTTIFSILSNLIGLSPSIGAFLAGSLVSSLPIKKIAKRVISPFSYAFVSYFFLSLGLLISPSFLLSNFAQILIVSLLFSLASFFITAFSIYLAGYDPKKALFAGAMFASISEFSLIIGRELSYFSNFDFISFFAGVLLLSTICSSFLVKAVPSIANYGYRLAYRIKFFNYIPQLQSYVLDVLGEFEGRGPYIIKARKIFIEFIQNLKNYALSGSLIFLIFKFVGNTTISIFGTYVPINYLFLVLIIALFLPTFLQLVNQLVLFLDAIFSVFLARTTSSTQEKLSKKLFWNFLFSIFFILTYFLMPVIFNQLNLPSQLNFLNIIALFGLLITFWDSLKGILNSLSLRVRR
ncbi:MAG: cation:proton antiporter [Candidatus Micrarchaeota archaeon]|nr:cation:proton antiporter [Candidatus Micrarchaeota archaeon]